MKVFHIQLKILMVKLFWGLYEVFIIYIKETYSNLNSLYRNRWLSFYDLNNNEVIQIHEKKINNVDDRRIEMPPSKVVGFIEAKNMQESWRKYDLQSIKNEKSEEVANIKQHLKYYYGNCYYWLLSFRFIYYFIYYFLLIILIILSAIIVTTFIIPVILFSICVTKSESIQNPNPNENPKQ